MDDKQLELLIHAIERAKWTEIVSALAVVVTCAVAVFALLYAKKQVEEAKNQMNADHKRSQRALAMEMCHRWSNFTSAESASVTRLMEEMNAEQCTAISDLTTLLINTKHKHHLLNIFELRFPEFATALDAMKKGDHYQLDGQYLLYLRHIAVRYLNMLESILITWTMGIADQDVVESEFAYLLDEKKGRTAMELLRTKIGAEGFPAIAMFMEALRKKEREKTNKVVRPAIA